MIYVFTGHGKGKTTAAIGQAMRAVGDGKKVLMIQFIKGPFKSGEDFLSEGLKPHFKLVKMGKGFVGIQGDNLPREEHQKAADEALEYAWKQIESGDWDLVILDEVNNAVRLGLVSKDEIADLIDFSRERNKHLILTGRDAPEEFLERADLVTEMRDIKHPHHKGTKAEKGLEF